MQVGSVKEIWQYPVKSLAGQRVEQTRLAEWGIPGDRCWAIVDADSGDISSAKRWPTLLNLQASLTTVPGPDEPVYGAAVPEALIDMPDGTRVGSRAPDAAAKLGQFLQRRVRIEPLAPPDNRDHYRLAQARDEASLKAEMGLLEGEPLPDFSGTPEDVLLALAEHATPPGTYFDAYPLHLLTTHSLDYLSQQGGVQAVVQRFRPNLLVEPTAPGPSLVENNWVGRHLQVGDALLAVHERTVRCSMPGRAQAPFGIEADRGFARAMVEHCERHLGVNLMVVRPGDCRVGDPVLLLDEGV